MINFIILSATIITTSLTNSFSAEECLAVTECLNGECVAKTQCGLSNQDKEIERVQIQRRIDQEVTRKLEAEQRRLGEERRRIKEQQDELLKNRQEQRNQEQARQKELQKQLQQYRELEEELKDRIKLQKDKQQAHRAEPLNMALDVSDPDSHGEIVITITTNKPLSSLKINGIEEGGGDQTLYTVKRIPKIGLTTIYHIIGTDEYGISASREVSIQRNLPDLQQEKLNPISREKTKPKNAVALIFGIDEYRRVPNAEYADLDAIAFYDYAIRALGVSPENIKILLNEKADRVAFFRSLDKWLPAQVAPGKSEVFIFFSGHGLPSIDGGKKYLLPWDADADFLEESSISMSKLISSISSSGALHTTLFFDSCYSGLNRQGETLLTNARPVALKARPGAIPTNITLFSASELGEMASGSDKLQHGLFSFFLMKGLEGKADKNADDTISIRELHEYIAEKVRRAAMAVGRSQNPTITTHGDRIISHM